MKSFPSSQIDEEQFDGGRMGGDLGDSPPMVSRMSKLL